MNWSSVVVHPSSVEIEKIYQFERLQFENEKKLLIQEKERERLELEASHQKKEMERGSLGSNWLTHMEKKLIEPFNQFPPLGNCPRKKIQARSSTWITFMISRSVTPSLATRLNK